MMIGTRDEFTYLECGGCGTVQIEEVPDLTPYYPGDYYSLAAARQTFIEEKLARRLAAPFVGDYFMTGNGLIGKLAAKRAFWFDDLFPPSLRDPILKLSKRSSILDFGCGGGKLLRDLASFVFKDLTGADAYIAHDLEFPKVKIRKQTLEQVTGRFDLVMLHHSFEHLPDPLDSLEKLRELLNPDGTLLIRIPIAAEAWERYGVNWFQLDAPRHLFLFTESAFRSLATRAGFAVSKVVYDSDFMQFVMSEQYARDIAMHDERAYRGDAAKSIFTPDQIDEFKLAAERLNAENRGDQACFYLVRR